MNRKFLLVTLEESLQIYDLASMRSVHIIETSRSFQGVYIYVMDLMIGICCLSPNAEVSYVAYPYGDKSGIIQVFDVNQLKPVCTIEAHKSRISKLAFNINGSLLATASDKGTIIRVFNAQTGKKLYQFRRGTYSAKIYSLSFNSQSTMLSVSSDSDTVHVFKMERSAYDNGGSTSKLMSTIMGKNVGDALESERDFAFIKTLPNLPTLCAFSTTEPEIMLIGSDGLFSHYRIDYENGGECILIGKNNFKPSEDNASLSAFSM